MKLLFLSGLTFLLLASVGFADTIIKSNDNETTELWEGKALTAHFKVGICHSRNGDARGVLILRHRNGQQDQYHLYGKLKNGHFELSHSSGHTLSGELTGPDSMKGKARLKSGLSLTLSGSRRINVPLAAADCAPLP